MKPFNILFLNLIPISENWLLRIQENPLGESDKRATATKAFGLRVNPKRRQPPHSQTIQAQLLHRRRNFKRQASNRNYEVDLENTSGKGDGEGDGCRPGTSINLSLDQPSADKVGHQSESNDQGTQMITSEKVVHDMSSTSDSERTESDTESGTPKGDKVQGEIVSSTVTSGVSIPVSDPEKAHEAQAGPDPEPMQEDQTGSKSGKLHVSLAGPNPEHMDDEFIATAYPKVHENLKLITGERVLNDKPESHSGSMSSLKNLDDTVNFGDQFLHDQPTEDDQEKSKAREESDSNIPDLSHQTVNDNSSMIAPFTMSTSSDLIAGHSPPITLSYNNSTTSLPESLHSSPFS
ncbi:hypothetical protein Tco_1407516 [Tanacetum coccineum]